MEAVLPSYPPQFGNVMYTRKRPIASLYYESLKAATNEIGLVVVVEGNHPSIGQQLSFDCQQYFFVARPGESAQRFGARRQRHFAKEVVKNPTARMVIVDCSSAPQYVADSWIGVRGPVFAPW